MVRHIKQVLVVVVVCLFQLSGFAQKVEFKYIHKFSVKEGLSSYNIRKIVKDEYGYTWVATQDGLNRFDGHRFIQYNTSASPQFKLPASDIRDLIADTAKHQLWVLSNIDGIFLINTTSGSVTAHIPIPYTQPDDWSQCFKKIGPVFLVGNFHGLKLFDSEKGKWLPDPIIPGSDKTSPLSSETGGIVTDRNGNAWVFINGYGIVFYDQHSRSITSYTDENKLFGSTTAAKIKFTSPVLHTDSTIIAGTSSGLKILRIHPGNTLEDVTGKNKTVSSLLSSPIFSIALLPDKSLFIGLDAKTIHLDASLSGVTTIRDKDGSSDNTNWLGQAKTIVTDKTNAWIGSKEGLAYMSLVSFATEIYSSRSAEFLNLSHVYDIEPVNNNELLTGGKNGLYLVNRTTKTCTTVKGGVIVNNLFPNYDSAIVVTTSSGNFIYKNNSLVSLGAIYPELIPYQNNMLVDNAIIGDSVMLIGTDDESCLIVWNFKKRSAYVITATSSPLALGSNTINDIYKATDGTTWILGDKIITILAAGLNNAKVIRIVDKAGRKELGPLFDAAETKDNYWLCAYGIGLLRLDKNWGLLDIYNEPLGLSNNGVYKLFKYDKEKLLVTSNNGLSIFDNESMTIQKIFEEEGLHANTFEEATGCFSNNEIYTGGPNGFCIINPFISPVQNDPFFLYINAISVATPFNVTIDTFSNDLNRFRIPSNSTQTTIRFSAINYSSPQRITYQYRISELQNEWINLNTKNFIDFIGIKPGTYHLQVQAFDEDGLPSGIKELTLIFLPKWYQTWWFKTLLALLAVAIVYALYRVRINQFRKEQQIRSKLASDLHDDLGSTMNSVKVYANLAIMEKQPGKYLPLIKDGTQDAITGIRDIIWVLDDSKDSVEQLISRIGSFASPLCEANNIRYKQELTDNARDLKLGQEERRNLYMMLKEAVNNAVKYSGGTTIDIEVALKKGKPVFLVTDDGKGFDTTKTSDGNGLKNMQRRAKEIKYQILISSSPGNGAIIRFEKR